MKKKPSAPLDLSALTPDELDSRLREQAADDPLSPYFDFGMGHYRPSPTQRRFHESNTYFKLVLGGGRMGKTTSCLADLVMAMRGIHPWKPWEGPFTALAFAISRQQAAMVMGKKLFESCELPSLITAPDEMGVQQPVYPLIGTKPLIPEWEIADLGTMKVGFRATYWVKLINGSELWFSWSAAEDIWKKIQGPKIKYGLIDENAGTKKMMIELRKRLQDSQRPGSWGGCLVWGGHGTEDNDAFTEYREKCEKREPDHEAFHLQAGETGAVDAAATARFAAALTPEERRVHIDATADAGDLVRVFKQQWSDDLILRTDRVVASDDNLWVGYDPGVDHPMGMLVDAVGRDAPNTLTTVKAWIRRGGTIDDDIAMLAQWLDGRAVAGFVYDTNLKNKDRGGGPSVLEQFKDKLRMRGVTVHGWWQSRKNHAPGINLMREKMMKRELRVNGSPDSGGMLLVSQLKKYRGREGTRFTGEGGVVKKDDELVDALRYVLMAGPVWRREWACGLTATRAGEDLDSDLEPQSAQEIEHARQLALSRRAGELRSGRGAAGRVRGMRSQLWLARTDTGQAVPVPPWQRGDGGAGA